MTGLLYDNYNEQQSMPGLLSLNYIKLVTKYTCSL